MITNLQSNGNDLREATEVAHWQSTAASQNNDEESKFLSDLAFKIDANRSFVEFGFQPFQFNSVSLVKNGFKGLLLDGDENNCISANRIFKNLGANCKAIATWISLDTLDPILDFVKELDEDLGILNVDIDGNDYWILKRLLESFRPHIICTEYNASLGLRSITIPYNKDYDRHKAHKSGWYHGASITAFHDLLKDDFVLVKNIAGLNLFFLRRDKIAKNTIILEPSGAYAECDLRNRWSGTVANEQWNVIKDLPFVDL